MPTKPFSASLLLALSLLVGLAGWNLLTLNAAAQHKGASAGCHEAQTITPALRRELLAAREAVWRAWFANDRKQLEVVIPQETIAINAGEQAWQDRAEILAAARSFAESGAKLVRLEYPRTEIQVFGDVAILYTNYLFEVESQGERQTTAGRGTEIFVRRNGRWVNPGWHTDSGR